MELCCGFMCNCCMKLLLATCCNNCGLPTMLDIKFHMKPRLYSHEFGVFFFWNTVYMYSPLQLMRTDEPLR